jgi:malonyl-CoA/methylmalonyl-CoA synthetase
VTAAANLYALIASRFPEDRSKPCFLFADGSAVSYGAFEAMIGRMAALLRVKGLEPGDRVAFQGAKSVEAMALYLATLQLGAVFLPLNTAYTQAEVDYFIGDAEPRLFVADPVALAKEAEGLQPLTHIHPSEPGDLASLLYTSGTTGRSKGAMLSHGNLASNGLALVEAWGFGPGDVLLHALPIYHIHGLFISSHCALLTGSTLLWLQGFDDKAVVAALPRATVMMGVPTYYTRLLANPAFDRQAAASIRLFVSGSAPLLESTFREFEARTGQRILERYGMSEATVITSNPLNGERVPGSVGYPLPGVSLRIAGGETGVIQIKWPSVFGGYWRMPDKTAEEHTEDGYFITGDVGRQDPDGRVWISGRAKDLIISGGLNVYPKEIELILDQLPGVKESAVIGLPHPDFGEAVAAVVSGQGEEAAIIAELKERLAGFKVPKRVFFVDSLPRNAMSKVQKNVLRQTYADAFTPPRTS